MRPATRAGHSVVDLHWVAVQGHGGMQPKLLHETGDKHLTRRVTTKGVRNLADVGMPKATEGTQGYRHGQRVRFGSTASLKPKRYTFMFVHE